MKKFFSFVSFTAIAVASSVAVYLYMNDKEVQTKVNRAVVSVGDAVSEIAHSVKSGKLGGTEPQTNPVAANQAWADEQWEALGI